MYQISFEGISTLRIDGPYGQLWSFRYSTADEISKTSIIESTREAFERREGFISQFELTLIMLEISDETGLMLSWARSDKNNYRRYIGGRLRERRIKACISNKDAAEFLEISERTLAKIEEGRYSADLELIQHFAQCVGSRLDII